MPKEFLNDKWFEFETSKGIVFESEYSDFRNGVNYPKFLIYSPALLAESVAEMISHHAINIHPRLNGFAGYDRLEFHPK